MGVDLSLLTPAEGSVFVKLRRLLERTAIDLHTRRPLIKINQLNWQRDKMPAQPENAAIANDGVPNVKGIATRLRQFIGEQFIDFAAFFPIHIDNLNPTDVMPAIRAET